MAKNIFIRGMVLSIWLLLLSTSGIAQSGQGEENLQIPAGEINNIQQRIEELRRAGVPESRIMEIMQQELQNMQPAAEGSSTAAPTGTSPQPAPGLGSSPAPPS